MFHADDAAPRPHDRISEALARQERVMLDLSHLANAFRATGNETVACRLERLGAHIHETGNAIRAAVDDWSEDVLRAADGASANVLRAAVVDVRVAGRRGR